MKFAVIQTGGKQHKVTKGDVIEIEKLDLGDGEQIIFENVLLRSDGDSVEIGTPYIERAVVKGKVISHGKSGKKMVFRYHSKTRYRKKKGHRQRYTKVKIGDL